MDKYLAGQLLNNDVVQVGAVILMFAGFNQIIKGLRIGSL